MNPEILNVINDFNQTLLSLATNIANICPNSIIGNNIKDIQKFVNNKQNLTKFIDIFCINVLKYKDKIDEGDETFFMEKDYTEDIGNPSDKNNKDEIVKNLDIAVAIKSIWSKLNSDNRKIVIMNMQILCALAQMYFEHVSSQLNNTPTTKNTQMKKNTPIYTEK